MKAVNFGVLRSFGDGRLRPLDCFAIVNVVLFAIMSAYVYWDRFVLVRNTGNVRESFVYGCGAVALLGWMWLRLRVVPVRWALLSAVQLGITIAFAGGICVHAGVRLYDIRLLPIGDFRFDKPVHLVNSVIVGLVLWAVLRAHRWRIGRPPAFVMVLLIVGVGAVWEIVEYVVVKTFRDAGVGDYDNNMQDMIANLAGALVYVLLPQRWHDFFAAAPRQSLPDRLAPELGGHNQRPGTS